MHTVRQEHFELPDNLLEVHEYKFDKAQSVRKFLIHYRTIFDCTRYGKNYTPVILYVTWDMDSGFCFETDVELNDLDINFLKAHFQRQLYIQRNQTSYTFTK